MCTHAFVIDMWTPSEPVPDFNRETQVEKCSRAPRIGPGDRLNTLRGGRQGAQNRSDSKTDRLSTLRGGRPDASW